MRCPDCGANLALVGRSHRCLTNPADTTNNTTNRLTNPSIEVQRVYDWRKGNPDRYREYMRVYMAKRRAKVRAAK
jgi:hypothetical protein